MRRADFRGFRGLLRLRCNADRAGIAVCSEVGRGQMLMISKEVQSDPVTRS